MSSVFLVQITYILNVFRQVNLQQRLFEFDVKTRRQNKSDASKDEWLQMNRRRAHVLEEFSIKMVDKITGFSCTNMCPCIRD